jgi:hypothetical protein
LEVIYEKDLRPFKYRILLSSRHDRIVREMAVRLGIKVHALRKGLIEHFDMQLLENLPARYEAGVEQGESDPVGRALGADLFTRSLPLVRKERMEVILRTVQTEIDAGVPMEEAVAHGQAWMQEALFS